MAITVENMGIIVPLTAGLFSLLGAFTGAALARRTDYEKWLRESRSEVFARFLNLLSEARFNASNAIFDNSIEPLARDIKKGEAYRPALEYSRIVCLYLPKEKRREFELLANEFSVLHDRQCIRGVEMQKRLESMQSIFEECL